MNSFFKIDLFNSDSGGKDTHPYVLMHRHEYFIKNMVSNLVEEGRIYIFHTKIEWRSSTLSDKEQIVGMEN